MWQYIIKRTLLTFPVLFIVSLFTFSILHLAPGDPAAVLLGGEYIAFATIEDIEEARRALGVDKPPLTQYLEWISGIFHGDFGTSLFTGQSVIKLISYGAEASVTLMITSIILSLGIGIPLGILAGWKMNSYIDRSAMIFSVFGFCIPSFWLASGIIYIFCIKLGWFPVFGFRSLFSDDIGEFLLHITLPTITLTFGYIALITRMTRSTMIEVLSEDYMRTAKAKGLKEIIILGRHGLKNASMPIVTILGFIFATAFTGTIIVEQVFAIQGMSIAFLDAVSSRDFPVIQGFMMLFGLVYVFINLIIDLLYAYLNPKIRYKTIKG
tara:strand:- start:1033 stop:2004 length:972 start_codon:yes stop_codon:yes gene_type:complete